MELIIICTVKYLEIVNKYMYVYIHVSIWLLYVTYGYCTLHMVTVRNI